jgi:hypothetical protein
MQASARKIKRTRMQEKMVLENLNRNGINFILQNQERWAQALVELQKNQLALMQCLKRRGLIDDLMIAQELGAIEEMEQMKSKALIIKP